MAQPLIYGAVGPEGGDYLLEFTYDSAAYTMRNPFSVLGGTASEALSEGFLDVASYITFAYPIGRATYFLGQSDREVSPFFANGVEIELRYAGRASGVYDVRLNVRPNGDFYRTIYDGQHSAAPGGELVVRIVCKPESLQIYAGGQLVHESDPRTIDWDWVGPQPHYWMHLEASAPFDRYSALDGLVSTDGNRRFFQASRVPHIRAISYSLLRSLAPAFFRDFVRAYEVVGEGNGAAPPAPPPPAPPDDLDNDTVLVMDAPPMSPIPVESLPFRAVFNYALGGGGAPPGAFMLSLDAGTYKFSTALSPDREEHDTKIALYSFEEAAPLYVNDDISDGPPYDYRSEIIATLPAGEYGLVVCTRGAEFDADGSITLSDSVRIPLGTVLRVSKV